MFKEGETLMRPELVVWRDDFNFHGGKPRELSGSHKPTASSAHNSSPLETMFLLRLLSRFDIHCLRQSNGIVDVLTNTMIHT